jgi:Mrp family chromosome partitioning ATPase
MGIYYEAFLRKQKTGYEQQPLTTFLVFDHHFDFPRELVDDFVRIQEQIEYAQPASSRFFRGRAKMVAVAGASAQAGTSTLAYYLAMLYAYGPGKARSFNSATIPRSSIKSAAKVLLIDANPHNPTLHDFFHLEPEFGLTEMVEDHLPFNEVIKFTQHGALALLTLGRPARSRPELFRSIVFTELLSFACQEFTHVILDFAPVSEHADILLAAPALDGVLLSVRTGRTSVDDVQRAKTLLESHQTQILGVVMNGK